MPEYRGGLRPGVVVLCLLDANPSFGMSHLFTCTMGFAQSKRTCTMDHFVCFIGCFTDRATLAERQSQKKKALEPSTVSEGFQRCFGRVAERF